MEYSSKMRIDRVAPEKAVRSGGFLYVTTPEMSWRAKMKAIDLVCQRFGKLLVKSRVENTNSGRSMFECVCDCGNTNNVNGSDLRRGATKSCGCGIKGRPRIIKTDTVMSIPEYVVWVGMKQRCNDKNSKSYRYYGGKGITVSEEWMNFDRFLFDMGERPSSEYTLERIDSLKGYCKENCKWATYSEQNRNTSRNRLYTFNGKTQCITDWANDIKCNPISLFARLNRGWSFEKAITTPIKRKQNFLITR